MRLYSKQWHIYACICICVCMCALCIIELCWVRASEVFRTALWMRHYGSKSLKRTFLWSNSPIVEELNLGKLSKARVCQRGPHK